MKRKDKTISILDNIAIGVIAAISLIAILGIAFCPLIISVCVAVFNNQPIAYFGLFGLIVTIPTGWLCFSSLIKDETY